MTRAVGAACRKAPCPTKRARDRRRARRAGQSNPPPFLTLPTSCTGPLQTSVEADSWQEPANVLTYRPASRCRRWTAATGCPSARRWKSPPDVQSASTPTGLTVKVHVPQEASVAGEGLADSDVQGHDGHAPRRRHGQPRERQWLAGLHRRSGRSTRHSGNEIGFTGSEELNKDSEPGVKTPQFTAYLPGSPAAKAAVEAHQIPEAKPRWNRA